MQTFPTVPNPEIAAAKKSARQTMRNRLRALNFDRLAVAANIFRRLEQLPEFNAAQTLGVYLDFGFEAPIRPFLPRLFEPADRVVAAPRCVERDLEFYRLAAPRPVERNPFSQRSGDAQPPAVPPKADPPPNAPNAPTSAPFLDFDAFAPEKAFELTDVSSGSFGIWEPTPDATRRVPPSAFDLVLVPGLAFDLAGGRLGRGAGFYDRFLSALPEKTRLVGVALDEQIVEKTPRDAFDLPVDALATPTRLVVFQ